VVKLEGNVTYQKFKHFEISVFHDGARVTETSPALCATEMREVEMTAAAARSPMHRRAAAGSPPPAPKVRTIGTLRELILPL
jgi:hypothetical protein